MNKFLCFLLVFVGFACNGPAKDAVKNELSVQEDFRPKENSQMSDYKYITSVRKDNQWYFINERNEVLFDKVFTYATFFSDDLVCVAMDGVRWDGEDQVYGAYYTAMDKEGNFLDHIKSDLPFVFKEGRSIISFGPAKKLINKEGEVLKEANLAGYGEFNEGKIPVFRDGKIEYWDTEGNVVIGPAPFTTQGFSEERALVLLDGKYGFIDDKGDLVVDYQYEGGRNYKNGYAAVKKDGSYYFINKDGKEIYGPYQECRDFQEGKAAVNINGDWSFIDTEGDALFTETFFEADSFSEDIAIVRTHERKLARVSSTGEISILEATVALQFKNGIAIAEENKKMGYMNLDGTWLIDPQYERIHDFSLRD